MDDTDSAKISHRSTGIFIIKEPRAVQGKFQRSVMFLISGHFRSLSNLDSLTGDTCINEMVFASRTNRLLEDYGCRNHILSIITSFNLRGRKIIWVRSF